MRSILLAVLFAMGTAAYAQQAGSIEAESTGTCSPNIVSTEGRVEFTCNAAIDDATAKKIVSLLNQVLRHENNSASINEKLDQILEFLQTHTQNPYDPLVLYSFDGVQKRVISTDKGQQDVTFGGTAADAFKQMAEFQTRRDWSSLLTLCQKEIDEEHGWATPFLFCSVAHINTGTLDIAEEELRKAKNIVHDSPDYADAIRDVNRGLEEARKRAH